MSSWRLTWHGWWWCADDVWLPVWWTGRKTKAHCEWTLPSRRGSWENVARVLTWDTKSNTVYEMIKNNNKVSKTNISNTVTTAEIKKYWNIKFKTPKALKNLPGIPEYIKKSTWNLPWLISGLPEDQTDRTNEAHGSVVICHERLMEETSFCHLCRQCPPE